MGTLSARRFTTHLMLDNSHKQPSARRGHDLQVRYFYALLGGEVEASRRRADGTDELLYVLRAGEYFGEGALLEVRFICHREY
jgi:CRP-like cAMP-binding protein